MFKRKQAETLGIPVSKVRILVLDVCTRWNSAYIMVQRILDLKESVILYCAADCDECETEFTQADWELMKSIVHVLKPFF